MLSIGETFMKKKVGDRIKHLRTSNSITQKQLGSLINASVVTIQCWEKGSKSPSMEAIISLANVFHVTTDYLLCLESDAFLLTSSEEMNLIENFRDLDNYGRKVVAHVCSAERSRLFQREIQHAAMHVRHIPRYLMPAAAGVSFPFDNEAYELIEAANAPANADFAVKIQGDSMNPFFKDGDTAYVMRTSDLRSGDIGIFCVDGAVYCKKYRPNDDGSVSLISTNPEYQYSNVVISNDSNRSFVCYGKVITKKS